MTVTRLSHACYVQRQFYYIDEAVQQGTAVGLAKVLGDYPSLYEARSALPEVAKYWDPWMQQQDEDPRKFSGVLHQAAPLLLHDGYMTVTWSYMELHGVTWWSHTDVRHQAARLRSASGATTMPARVLDWCGNTGGNALIMAQMNRALNITVLDLPTQCAKADAAFAAVWARTVTVTQPSCNRHVTGS